MMLQKLLFAVDSLHAVGELFWLWKEKECGDGVQMKFISECCSQVNTKQSMAPRMTERRMCLDYVVTSLPRACYLQNAKHYITSTNWCRVSAKLLSLKSPARSVGKDQQHAQPLGLLVEDQSRII